MHRREKIKIFETGFKKIVQSIGFFFTHFQAIILGIWESSRLAKFFYLYQRHPEPYTLKFTDSDWVTLLTDGTITKIKKGCISIKVYRGGHIDYLAMYALDVDYLQKLLDEKKTEMFIRELTPGRDLEGRGLCLSIYHHLRLLDHFRGALRALLFKHLDHPIMQALKDIPTNFTPMDQISPKEIEQFHASELLLYKTHLPCSHETKGVDAHCISSKIKPQSP